MTLGDKIRKYRTLKGLTQAQLGSMVKLTGDRIRQYENDVRKPKDGKLFEIADALDVNPSTLAEPDFDDPTSVMHVLFELEDIYGLHFEKVGDNYQLAFSKGEYSSANWIIEGLAAWVKKRDELQPDINDSNSTIADKKNDYIFFQGDVPNKLYLILNGEVELGSINVNGKVLRITNISEGEDFGEVELFLNKDRYSGYAKAKTDVKLLEIAKDFFGGRCEKNCSHHSKVVFNMLELFAKRTDENNQQLEVLTSGNLKQRIATYLLEHADNNNLVSLSMNREELALYLNTTRPSLSRTLLSLQEDGFIHLSSRKSIKILDAEALLYIE